MGRRGLRTLAAAAFADLFDQETAFGRLALVQVAMLAGDTLVTISLAGSLFFSITPQAAEGKVLLYLLLTVAPFAVVSPLLGPAIAPGNASTEPRDSVPAIEPASGDAKAGLDSGTEIEYGRGRMY